MSINDTHRELATEVLALAKAKGVMIASAESCTGGLLMAVLTEIPGSSAVVERGFITYSNEAKTEMLGVSSTLIQDHGAVSEPVAQAMAEGALDNSRATLTLSITGVAGPGATGAKPEGRVCFGVAKDGETINTITVEFGPLGRDNVRSAAVHYALGILQKTLA